MRFKTWIATGLAVCALGIFAGSAQANEVTGSGSVVMKDKFHSKNAWGSNLTLPRDGKITRVMDGTYGFDIRTIDGVQVASFLDPQQAVGLSLPAGTYVIDPYVCTQHRHHHIEVTASY